MKRLDAEQLKALLDTAFRLRTLEKSLVFLVDLPSRNRPDSESWRDRRLIAEEWFSSLHSIRSTLPFKSIELCTYENVGSNNNDLPGSMHRFLSPEERVGGASGSQVSTELCVGQAGIVIAMTEFSATAPLKIMARKHPFRGATMPGFDRDMIPALALDYDEVDRKVRQIKERMDRSISITVALRTGGREYTTVYDTRFRSGHASGGVMRNDGEVGNLPSGEAYIVPYEGERPGEKSLTGGQLPVQFEKEIVLYQIVENRATEVLSSGTSSSAESVLLKDEPAYGNIAEVGIGVLGLWGVKATGNTLLDEKLGLHIAFGRSDHFGGTTSPSLFRDPANVVHIDRVYVPSVQPDISVAHVMFTYPDSTEDIFVKDRFVLE